MNPVVKAILQGVEAVGVQVAGPGGAIIDGTVHAIVDHHGHVDDENAIDAAAAAIQVVEHLKGTDIADEVQFRMGCLMAETAFKTIKASLKPSPPA